MPKNLRHINSFESKFKLSLAIHKVTLLVILLYLFISGLFFWRIVFNQEVFIFGDNLLHVGPNMEFWREQISQGQAPLWNPYIFAGVPQLANPMTNTLSPLNFWFFLFNDVYRGLAVLVVVLIPFAAVGMYLFLKELRLPTLAAFLGGVLFAFSGTTLSNINDLNSLQAVVFIPWVLWLSQRYIVANNRVKLGIVLAFVLALQFVSGHPQYCYYTWLLLTGNLLIFGRQRLRQKLISIVLIFGLTVMLIAVELVPFVELTQLIHRPDSDQFANTNAIEIYDYHNFYWAIFMAHGRMVILGGFRHR